MLFFFFFFLPATSALGSAFVDVSFARRVTRAFSPTIFIARRWDREADRGQDRDPVEAFSINDKPTDASRRVINRVISHDDVEQVDSFHERRVSAMLFIFRRCWAI